MFKRPRLRLRIANVNAIAASAMIFLLAACGERSSPDELPADTTSQTEVPAPSVQAIWSTGPVPHKVIDLAVSETPEPQVLAVYETGGVQAFNLDGEELTGVIALDMVHIAPGGGIEAQGTRLTVFPAIDRSGQATSIALAPAVEQAFRLDVDYGLDTVVGVCAKASDGPGEGFLEVGFVQDGTQLTLAGGTLALAGETVTFAAGEAPAPAATNNCGLSPRLASHVGGQPVQLTYPDRQVALSLWNGELVLGTDGQKVDLRPGITVQVPERLTALAGRASVIAGGYPNGVVVAAGEISGQAQIVFLDPAGLTPPQAGGR